MVLRPGSRAIAAAAAPRGASGAAAARPGARAAHSAAAATDLRPSPAQPLPVAVGAAAPPTDIGDLVISPSAVRRLAVLAAKHPAGDDLALRVAVDAGGCSGFKYKLTLEAASGAHPTDDVIIRQRGATVVTDTASLELIRGSTIDYVEEMARSAFAVVGNPRAATGCGCGSSFAVREEAPAAASASAASTGRR